ncbi:MAG TPA: hypothetical protein PLL92_16685 [Alicycliphilus sp.]|nr:hypothetical protein [Alicycliphilus sp.]
MARPLGSYSTTSVAPALQQVWQSMRIMRSRFTTADLLVTTTSDLSTVHRYCRALACAGYLRRVMPRVNGRPGSRDVWALVRDSGPIAPIRRHDGSGVFDPNTGTVWGMDGQALPKPYDPMDKAREIQAAQQARADGASDSEGGEL